MRGAFRSSKHIPVNKQPVPDARNGLDLECLTALFSEMSQPADDTMDCVVADDPPIPASIDQFIPRDDLTLDAGKNDKNLHHSRFERLRLVTKYDLSNMRIDMERAERERRLVRKDRATGNGQTVVSCLPHCRVCLTQVCA